MLFLGSEPFCTGRNRFLDAQTNDRESSPKLFVTLRIGDLETVGQLDTGAPWSIITPDLADVLGLFDGTGPLTSISTRLGRVSGRLERVTITFVANSGESLQVYGTVFISREWSAGTFVGWAGLLERIRFAVDPHSNLFYFGAG